MYAHTRIYRWRKHIGGILAELKWDFMYNIAVFAVSRKRPASHLGNGPSVREEEEDFPMCGVFAEGSHQQGLLQDRGRGVTAQE
ncbi:hypothetical protein FKM82_025239 [Ascaphus truei]